jgi:hypothetical protein
MNNVKVYKNKLRNVKETYQPPVLQYQELGVVPLEYKSGIVPPNTPVIKPQEAANRNRIPSVRAESANQVVLPNIRPPQQTWAALDGDLFDETYNQPKEMVDNNNFYTEEAFGYSEEEDGNQDAAHNLLSVVNELEDDSYLLLVHGDTICSGPVEEIESEARALIFGEHALCNGEPISEESIVVLKKIKIKVGVFLQ